MYAQKGYNANIGILTVISTINTTSERLKARRAYFISVLVYRQLKLMDS